MKENRNQQQHIYYSKVIFAAVISFVIFALVFSLIFYDSSSYFHSPSNSMSVQISNSDKRENTNELGAENGVSLSDENVENKPDSSSLKLEEKISTDASIRNTTQATVSQTPNDTDFVLIRDYIPDIIIDLRYSTPNNFTGQRIYDFSEAYLRYSTVKKLIPVCDELRDDGFILKVWDAFRPYSAQCALWSICPDPAYVSNPETGSLSHCRGGAVDVTIVRRDGSEVPMPTDFDDFTEFADRDYSDIDDSAAQNARLLESYMSKNGFSCYFAEWWHYADTTTYQIDKSFLS